MARRRVIALGVVALWLSGAAFGLGLRPGLGSDPATMVVDVLLPAIFGGFALYLALAPGRLGLGPPARTATWVGVALPIAVATLAFVPEMMRPWARVEDLWHGVMGCGSFIVGLSVIPMLALSFALRRGCPNNAMPRAILVGVSISLLSASALGLHCQEAAGIHVALGHVAPVVLLALASALLLRRASKAD